MVPYKGKKAGSRKQYMKNKPKNGASSYLSDQVLMEWYMTF